VIAGLDVFMKGGKWFKTTPGVVAPLESQMDGNIEKVWQLLLKNHHPSLQMIVDELDIGKDTGWKIVVKELGNFAHGWYSTH
jgi:hypothetical protein